MKKLILVLITVFMFTLFFYVTQGVTVETYLFEELDNDVIIDEIFSYDLYSKYVINDQYVNYYNEQISIIVDVENLSSRSFKDYITSDIDGLLETVLRESKNLDMLNEDKLFILNEQGILVKGSNEIQLVCDITGIVAFTCDLDASLDLNVPKLDPSKPTVAFTFDDGPNKNTMTIVNALVENDMNATFFMLGLQMNMYPDTVLEMYNLGMEIGNHSYSHKYLTRISESDLNEEITKSESLYNKITGDEMELIRAPYGVTNDRVLSATDLHFIGWNIDTQDWYYRDTNKLVNYILNEIEDGDIVLMHDIHLSTAKAVEKVLPILKERGWQVTSVSELAELKGIELNDGIVYKSFD